MSNNKRHIRVSVSEEEYKLVREILRKTKGVGRKANVSELEYYSPEWLNEFPDGREQVKNPIKLEGKTAILSDLHLGIHDKAAIVAALTYLKKEKCENIILNGDILDSAAISRHPKSPDTPKYLHEIELAKKFLSSIRQDYPDARIIFKEGNHEDRLVRYIMEKATELEGIVSLKEMLELDKHGIEYCESTQILRANNVFVIHGHELKIGGGINPARALLLKSFESTIMGHVHRSSFSSGKSLSGKFIRTWTTGCLCKLSQGYMPYSSSNHGFAIIESDSSVRNLWINNGVVE
jgi:UDP-2,3-diacylglucosamine pyrophosphatase LpxH